MFTLAGQTASLPEVVAFAAGLLSVWFARGMRIATWPLGIVSVLCFAVVFFNAKLYADALLQLAFVAVSAYGWRSWAQRGRAALQTPVARASMPQIAAWLALCAASTAVCAWVLERNTDSPAPWPDAAIFSLSLLATWAQARRYLECWLAWIAVDLIAVPLYWSRSLALSSALYVIFLLLCIAGLIEWQRRLSPRQNGRPTA